MTEDQLSKKRVLLAIIVAYFIIGYFSCGHFNLNRSYYLNLSLPFENDIPFIPIFILGYSAVYLAIILIYVLIDDYLVFKNGMKLFFAVMTVHFILFLMLPVKMIRPNLAGADGIMNTLTHYYYLIDHPVNCFPSLHVSFPFTGTLVLWNYKRRWGYLLAVATAVIAISVVLVKQHYILDVTGAVLITSVVFWLIRRQVSVL